MTTRFLFLATVAAAFAALLAGAASARFEPGTSIPGSTPHQSDTTPSTVAEVEADGAGEANGVAASDGASITVTRPDGTSITCAVPTGLDVTPFLTGNVKVECADVNGMLTLREIKSDTGARAEVGDDDAVETEVDDDNSGPGNADEQDEHKSGPGSADDEHGDDEGGHDNSGTGGGDHGDGHDGGGEGD
jgi:hypothetical protein